MHSAGSSVPAGWAVIAGFNATKTARATAVVTRPAVAIASFRDTARRGAIRPNPTQPPMTISPSMPLNLQRIDRPAATPVRGRTRRVRDPRTARPESLQRIQPEPQRRDQERFVRDVGHRPVGVEAVERIDHQQERGDRTDATILDQDAAAKECDAAQDAPGTGTGFERRSGSPGSRTACSSDVPTPGVGGAGDAQVAARKLAPIRYFGHGLKVEGVVVEPGGMIELAFEEQVGVVALRDVGVLVHERVIEQAECEECQGEAPDRPARRDRDAEDCGEFVGRARCSGGVNPMCERSLE